MERKLAHVEKIEALTPIEGADRIEVAHVLGWECVVKKGEFKVGDEIVYIEIDSVVPDKPEFEFLRDRKFRVRTIKLRKQISQGLVVPLSVLPSNLYFEGDDVTEVLGITKYLTPSEIADIEAEERAIRNDKNKLRKFMMRYSWFRRPFLSRKRKKGFPYWVSKTDEERLQNMPKVLEEYKDSYVYITEKIDYQSGTWTGKMIPRFSGWIGKIIPVKKYQFVVCSRNLTTNDKNSLYWKIAKQYDIENILTYRSDITIQGEQGNDGVQGNKYKLIKPKMWVFNVINHTTRYFYNYNEIKLFCELNNLDYVPLLYKGKLSDFGSTVEDFVQLSRGKSLINPDIPREGIVVRCVENGNKIFSFKVINPDFLLKFDN